MSDSQTAEEFREEQKSAARDQALTGDNAVPEQRPQAFNQPEPGTESELFKRRQEAGEFEPMDKAAHDRAASSSQAKKAEKQEKKLGPETLREGQVVKALSGIYEGAVGTITEVHYKNEREANKARSGDPAAARFAQADSYLVRSRGGAHALMSLDTKDVELVPNGFTRRESVI